MSYVTVKVCKKYSAFSGQALLSSISLCFVCAGDSRKGNRDSSRCHSSRSRISTWLEAWVPRLISEAA